MSFSFHVYGVCCVASHDECFGDWVWGVVEDLATWEEESEDEHTLKIAAAGTQGNRGENPWWAGLFGCCWYWG